ncbi:stAR-related lipid transfer protein 7, mitochondrial [Dermatophagoides farinae]|uniref:stAR-related lipid transfer protein 7, mitochondrial n=1 Tax=Dermatophagoides farinae TaxID=6954 RepID=UPI003F5F4A57
MFLSGKLSINMFRFFMTAKQTPKNIKIFQNSNFRTQSSSSSKPLKQYSDWYGKLSQNDTKLFRWLAKTTLIKERIYDNLIVFTRILHVQSNVYLTLQIRRIAQLCHLYRRLYSPSEFQLVINNLKFFKFLSHEYRNYWKKYFLQRLVLFSYAVCCAYNWEERINDNEFDELIQDFIQNYEQNQVEKESNVKVNRSNDDDDDRCVLQDNGDTSFMVVNCMEADNSSVITEWEEIIKRENFHVLRKSINNSALYQYKVFGSFDDISAYSFYSVQKDLDYRKKWDKLVIKLDIVDVESTKPKTVSKRHRLYDTGNELIHWIMKYPYPMMNREYLYIRRSIIDFQRNFIVLISRSVTNSNITESQEQVRVYNYMSHMVIRPYESFDKPGFEFMLTYFDDPRASFPSPAYAWMAARGVPEFVEKLHQAALKFANEKPMENIFHQFTIVDQDDDDDDDDNDETFVINKFETPNEDEITNGSETAATKLNKDKINKKNFLARLPEPIVDFDSLIWN